MIGLAPLEGMPKCWVLLTHSLSLSPQNKGIGFNCFSSPLQLRLRGNGPVRYSMKLMEETLQGLCHQNIWSLNPRSALTSCVTLKKSLTIPEPDFFMGNMGIIHFYRLLWGPNSCSQHRDGHTIGSLKWQPGPRAFSRGSPGPAQASTEARSCHLSLPPTHHSHAW